MEPSLTFDHRVLPSKDGDIDWDLVAPRYHDHIMGPFAPEMVERKGGKARNLLLNYIDGLPFDNSEIVGVADIGCGPGNLIPFLAGRNVSLTGIDRSAAALSIARAKAGILNVDFRAIQADMLELETADTFDLVLSVNSIIPKCRGDVVKSLTRMRDCLKPTGKIAAILPSFDTTEYLLGLWEAHSGQDGSSAGIAETFKQAKKMSIVEKSYADDGVHVQCYHTPETIALEFPMAGLRLRHPPEKLYYPWELTKRFDYGFFPQADEEIWDWFVVAEPAER
jgi:SAM-dependent methyltransferase